ncbi:MAG TPA: hypothetical protein VGA50_01620 [Kiloniellales bacterium]
MITRLCPDSRSAAARERGEQIDDLDAGQEQIAAGMLLAQPRRLAVDRIARHVGGKGRAVIDRVADDVDQPSENAVARGHPYRPAGVLDGDAASQPGRLVHGDTSYRIEIQVLLDLDDQAMRAIPFDFERAVDRRQGAGGKRDIHDRTADGSDTPEPAVPPSRLGHRRGFPLPAGVRGTGDPDWCTIDRMAAFIS